MTQLLAQAAEWSTPVLDFHALAPELIMLAAILVVLFVDLNLEERSRWTTSSVAGIAVLAAFVPVITLALDGTTRTMFGGAYVVDEFSLLLKGLFLLTGYVVILLSTNYVTEGEYYQGEYYLLLLSSLLGMLVISSSRDLVSMFVALELLSIPAYMLASWRKRDLRSNEAGMKYFLLGAFASAVMLYGMSLLYGVAGSTLFLEIAEALSGDATPIAAVAIFFVIVGFAFKVSAVPFHSWAPDTYEGAPLPITAFLSVASKAAGFVAMLTLVFVAFGPRDDVWGPLFWVLAALTMTLGNLVALKQTNVVRMLAYSSVAQGGFILMPLAVIGEGADAAFSALQAVIIYLLIYAAMNLGAFAVVLAVSRRTRSGEISSWGGLFTYAPGLTVVMSIFLFSLAGIPPLGGWFAKFVVFRALIAADSPWAVGLALIGGINSVIALYYYASIAKEMWFKPVPDGDTTPVKVPAALVVGIGICAALTVAFGVFPGLVGHFTDFSDLPIVVAGP